MKSIARRYVYLPGMDKDIEVITKGSLKYQLVAKGPPRENPIHWPETKKPRSQVHVDFAGLINGVTYLVLVDSHSKWSEVITMSLTKYSLHMVYQKRLCRTTGDNSLLTNLMNTAKAMQ